MASVEASEIQQPVVYEGVESPNSAYVRLVSSDSHEFYFRREYALTKGTVKAMISGPGKFSFRQKVATCVLLIFRNIYVSAINIFHLIGISTFAIFHDQLTIVSI